MNEQPAADQILSVSSLTEVIRGLLEGEIGERWVRGEVSNLRRQSSGHIYFSIKDADAQISCVIFRGDAARIAFSLRDGQQIVGYGKLSVYAPRGSYQLVLRHVIEDGVGRLQQEFERLKRMLADEGLFDVERKQSIPALPRTVGIVTSPTGAALRDFVSILRRRQWRGRLVVLPARYRVQKPPERLWNKYAVRSGLVGLICWSSAVAAAAWKTFGPLMKSRWFGPWLSVVFPPSVR